MNVKDRRMRRVKSGLEVLTRRGGEMEVVVGARWKWDEIGEVGRMVWCRRWFGM